MKMRMIAIITALVLLILTGSQAAYADLGSQAAYAASDSGSLAAKLEDKRVYHTAESDYVSGDCVLSATRIMIRRAGILNDDDEWADITNAALRPEATEDGLMHNSFSYTDDGITYSVSTGSFEGEGDAARIEEFAELVRSHPEGIVVWGEGAAETGTHGVLVIDVVDGVVYAADTSNNMGDRNLGIQKWKDTTMLEPSLCTDYWYISDISGGRPVYQLPEQPYDPLRPGIRFA